MGNSLEKFQRHYWSKSKVVTEDTAKEYFEVKPETIKLVVLPKAANG